MNFKEIMAQAMQPKNGSRIPLTVRAMDEDGAVEILVYDQIGYWGITAEAFKNELMAIEADTIHLRIDSPGGDVFAARAMKTALEQHPAKVISHVDGWAASAASYLMLGGDEVEIAKGAFVMIHNAWSFTIGNFVEHDKASILLQKIDGTIRADYAKKSGKSADEFVQLMDDETWLEASEALEVGLVDRVYEKEGGANNRFNASIYMNAPDVLKNAPEDEDGLAHRAAQMRKLDFFERAAP